MSRASFNSEKITTQNIADALRLLMKVGRDKSKAFPRPRGPKAREAWKSEAYDLLGVKRGGNIMQDISAIFKNFENEAQQISKHLNDHYSQSNFVNRNIAKPRIEEARALFLIVSKDLYKVPHMIPETQVFKKAKTVCDIISTDSVHEEISEDSSPIRGSLDKSNQKSDFVPAGILKDPEDRYIRSDSYRGAAANFNTISNQEEERKVRFNSGLNATHRVSRHSKYTRPDEKAIEDYKDNRANRGKIRKEVKELTSPEALRLNREENERDIAHVSSV